MKATVLSDNLRAGLSFAHHGISSRSQLPVLLNFLIEAKDGFLYISSTDLEIGIRTKVAAKVEEEGETTIPAKTFLDLLSNITQDKVDLSTKDSVLELTGQKIKTSFPTLPASEFPKLYSGKGEKEAVIKKQLFDQEVSRVAFAAAPDASRPALSGVLVRREGKGFTIVATDGYRLSLKTNFEADGKKESSVSLLVPARVVKELLALKDENENENIDLYVSDSSNQVLFEYGDTTLVGRLIEVEYPDYKKLIPDDFGTKVVFDKAEALNAVRACSVFAREAANIVKMTIGKDSIVFSASASSVGENTVEVEAEVQGEENTIAFNARYLLDLFSSVGEGKISFEMNGPLSPGVFRLENDPSFLHLIMPIKVQA
jgi:DNA polymerase III subunit beta